MFLLMIRGSKMTYEELVKYWIPAAQKHITPTTKHFEPYITHPDGSGHAPYRELDLLLGLDEYKNYYFARHGIHPPLPVELKNLLKALVGPYGKAVLKAYRIKKGLVK